MNESFPKQKTIEPAYEKNERGFQEFKQDAQEILNGIDAPVLEKLFQEEQRRSGAPSEDIKSFVDYREITCYGNHYRGIITLNPKLIYEYAEKNGVDFKQAIISIYIHESTHANAHNFSEHPTPITLLKSFVSKQETSGSGYSRGQMNRFMPKTSFNLFNEGVTDAIAAEVFDSYGAQTGDNTLRESSYASVYLDQRVLLESFIALVALKTNVPKDTVWGGIKQGYFQGLDLENSEMALLYNELAMKKIMKEINNLDSEKDRDLFTNELTKKISFSIDEELGDVVSSPAAMLSPKN